MAGQAARQRLQVIDGQPCFTRSADQQAEAGFAAERFIFLNSHVG